MSKAAADAVNDTVAENLHRGVSAVQLYKSCVLPFKSHQTSELQQWHVASKAPGMTNCPLKAKTTQLQDIH